MSFFQSEENSQADVFNRNVVNKFSAEGEKVLFSSYVKKVRVKLYPLIWFSKSGDISQVASLIAITVGCVQMRRESKLGWQRVYAWRVTRAKICPGRVKVTQKETWFVNTWMHVTRDLYHKVCVIRELSLDWCSFMVNFVIREILLKLNVTREFC